MKKYLSIIGLLFITIIWGGGFVVNDIALGIMSPFEIMTLRFLVASILLFCICMKQLKNITKEEIMAGVWLGIFLFAGFAFQTVGLKYTTPSKNAFLTATNVVFVPFIAMCFYKKKVNKQSLLGALMAIAGAGTLSLDRNLTLGFGDSLTLMCAVCFAFQIFLTGNFAGKYRASILNLVQMVVAFVLSFVTLLISGDINLQISRPGIISVMYLGILGTTVAFLIQTVAQKNVDETKSAIILSMEAVFGSLFSIMILKEAINIRMIIGCALILGAVIVSETKFVKEQEKVIGMETFEYEN